MWILRNDKKYNEFQLNLAIDGKTISCEIAFTWMSLDFIDHKSILVHIVAGAVTQQAITLPILTPIYVVIWRRYAAMS